MHEVRGRASLQRLPIKISALRHKVGDVRDVNADLVDGSANVVDRQSIVEVLRRDWIDSEDPPVSQVQPLGELLFGNLPLARLRINILREYLEAFELALRTTIDLVLLRANFVLLEEAQCLSSQVAAFTETLDDSALGSPLIDLPVSVLDDVVAV